MRVVAYVYTGWHPIPERDDRFHSGFTEWELLRDCRPRFDGHAQPRVPREHAFDGQAQHREHHLEGVAHHVTRVPGVEAVFTQKAHVPATALVHDHRDVEDLAGQEACASGCVLEWVRMRSSSGRSCRFC